MHRLIIEGLIQTYSFCNIYFHVCHIFIPNSSLVKVVEDLGRLNKGLTKQDLTVIVGGSLHSLDRNYCCYLIEKDLDFISERTVNTNVGFVNLLERYDELWMNRRVRTINL
jgi:hypothetical protein